MADETRKIVCHRQSKEPGCVKLVIDPVNPGGLLDVAVLVSMVGAFAKVLRSSAEILGYKHQGFFVKDLSMHDGSISITLMEAYSQKEYDAAMKKAPSDD